MGFIAIFAFVVFFIWILQEDPEPEITPPYKIGSDPEQPDLFTQANIIDTTNPQKKTEVSPTKRKRISKKSPPTSKK